MQEKKVEESRNPEPEQIKISFDEWLEKYKPIMDELNNEESLKDFLCKGSEEMVSKAIQERRIWTMGFEEDLQWLSSGARLVNREQYWITEVPFEDNTEVIVDIYPEDEYRDDTCSLITDSVEDLN